MLSALLKQAFEQYQQGRLEQAAQLYAQVLEQGSLSWPQQAEARHMLELIARQQKADPAAPLNPEVYWQLGLAYQMQGDLEQALWHYQQTQIPAPSTAQLLNLLGNGYRQIQNFKAALVSYQQALSQDPELTEVYYNLGALLDQLGEGRAAIRAFEAFLQRCPQAPEAPTVLCHIGRIWVGLGQRPRALQCYAQALKLQPDCAMAYNELGLLLLEEHDLEQAQLCFEHSLSLNSLDSLDSLDALAGQAGVLQKLRRFEEAFELLQPIVEQGIYKASVANFYGTACLHRQTYQQGIAYIHKTLQAQPQLHPRLESPLYFRLGELHDGLQQPQKAFPCFLRGNALKPRVFKRAPFQALVEAMIETFCPDLLAQLASVASRPTGSSLRPIFIVGMPRSGTTLTEQILCSHPQVHGAGELDFMENIWRQLQQGSDTEAKAWRSRLLRCSTQDWQGFAQQYLEQMAELAAPEAVWVSDKMPHNFLYLGLIQILFPQARIIHCQRHPLDTCISCFSHDFIDLEYSNDLEDLGHYYQLYLKLMAHWEKVLSLPIYSLRYEELVSNQEKESRRLLAHCELDWHEDCLRFYQTERRITTASYAQVRKPIYRSSIGRYRAYASFLEPIVKILKL